MSHFTFPHILQEGAQLKAALQGRLGAAALPWRQRTSASADSGWGELIEEQGALGGHPPPAVLCLLPIA